MPDAHDPSKKHRPTMLTTDLALRIDPAYEEISRRFHENPDEFRLAFAKAWYKLLHRDMGPVSRYLGPWVAGAAALAGPGPRRRPRLVGDEDVAGLKAKVLDSGLSVEQLVGTAWASAATLPRHRQAGRRQRRPHPPRAAEGLGGQPAGELAAVLETLEEVQQEFNGAGGAAGLAGRPDRARRLRGGREGGEGRRPRRDRAVHAGPHRRHARSRPTSSRSRSSSRGPTASATTCAPGEKLPPETLLLDRAYMLGLSAPEMTVLVGGLRALGRQRRRRPARRPHRPGRAPSRTTSS